MDYYVTVAEGTIDEHLWAVVTAKQATLDAVLDGRSDTGHRRRRDIRRRRPRLAAHPARTRRLGRPGPGQAAR